MRNSTAFDERAYHDPNSIRKKTPPFVDVATMAESGRPTRRVEIPGGDRSESGAIQRLRASRTASFDALAHAPNVPAPLVSAREARSGLVSSLALAAAFLQSLADVANQLLAEINSLPAVAKEQSPEPHGVPEMLTPNEFGAQHRPPRSAEWVRNKCRSGAFPTARKKHGSWLIPRAALNDEHIETEGGASEPGYQRTRFAPRND
jgi:hypothetical protein